jgi:esterase/lipase
MEKDLSIKTPDNKLIYGTLARSKKKSNILIVLVHGFTGNKDEHLHFNGAKFFMERGFDTFRLNLYGWGKKARRLRDITISLHGNDISTVLKYFRKKYKKIFVIGHSYGGLSLLFVDQSLADGLVFWDASYITSKDRMERMRFNKSIYGYVMDWGIEYILGKKLIDEIKHFPDCKKLIKAIHKPVLFITAEKGNMKKGKLYLKAANNPKKLINIKGADHNFNKFKDEDTLLKQTYLWIKKYD